MLRMNDLAFEIRLTGKIRFIALVIVVVAGTPDQKARGIGFRLASRLIHRSQFPAFIQAGPVSGLHRKTIANMPLNIMFFCSFTDVIFNGSAVRQHLATCPGAEIVAEGKHVGIRANARIAEQVPGASE